MSWEPPDFVEIKMDAEVSAYQGDDGTDPRPPWLSPCGADAEPHGSS